MKTGWFKIAEQYTISVRENVRKDIIRDTVMKFLKSQSIVLRVVGSARETRVTVISLDKGVWAVLRVLGV